MALVDYFLKIDGIQGESQDKTHKNEIEIMSFGWGATNTGTALVGGGGFAYVFTRSGASWSQQAKLAASDGTAMGSSAALSGDTALLGAPSWNTSSDVNSAAADGAHGDYFGYSVALSGDTALVGPEMDSVPYGPHQGSAYVFVRSGTNWSQQAQLTAAGGGPYAPTSRPRTRPPGLPGDGSRGFRRCRRSWPAPRSWVRSGLPRR